MAISNHLISQWGEYVGSNTWGISTTVLNIGFNSFYSLCLSRENDQTNAFTADNSESVKGSSISSYINKTLTAFQHQSYQTLSYFAIGV